MTEASTETLTLDPTAYIEHDGHRYHVIGPLERVVSYIRLRSDTATKPRLSWSRDCPARPGDPHRWLPLPERAVAHAERASRHVPCDGSCGGVCGGEGYEETYYECWSCGDVGAEYEPDFHARTVGVRFLESVETTIVLDGHVDEIPDPVIVLPDDGTRLVNMLGKVLKPGGDIVVENGRMSVTYYGVGATEEYMATAPGRR